MLGFLVKIATVQCVIPIFAKMAEVVLLKINHRSTIALVYLDILIKIVRIRCVRLIQVFAIIEGHVTFKQQNLSIIAHAILVTSILTAVILFALSILRYVKTQDNAMLQLNRLFTTVFANLGILT